MTEYSIDLFAIAEELERLNQQRSQTALVQSLMKLSRLLPELPASYRQPEFEVEGCETTTWLVPLQSGLQPNPIDSAGAQQRHLPRSLTHMADSQSSLMRGLLAILLAQKAAEQPSELAFDETRLSASKKLAWQRLQQALNADMQSA